MIRLQPGLFDNLSSHEGLKTALQQSIMLEHATIPAYLYALYSIKPGANGEIQRLILSIVLEEMLHMALASNILSAIGGAPVIDEPGFIPTYPGPLPGSVEAGLSVPLARLSLDLVQNVFMVIEEPEDPIHFPVKELALAPGPPLTIGSLYRAIEAQIKAQGQAIFVGDPARQVTHGFPAAELFAVTDVDSAVKAIDVIVEQGEGTKQSPLDPEQSLLTTTVSRKSPMAESCNRTHRPPGDSVTVGRRSHSRRAASGRPPSIPRPPPTRPARSRKTLARTSTMGIQAF
jgi:rubrerythrin